MKVLLTGHQGYLGTVMAPVSPASTSAGSPTACSALPPPTRPACTSTCGT